MTRKAFHRYWTRVKKLSGLTGIRPHDLRHTAGTYAAQAGFNAFNVRDFLGHRSIAMSARYVERAADSIRATADAVGITNFQRTRRRTAVDENRSVLESHPRAELAESRLSKPIDTFKEVHWNLAQRSCFGFASAARIWSDEHSDSCNEMPSTAQVAKGEESTSLG